MGKRNVDEAESCNFETNSYKFPTEFKQHNCKLQTKEITSAQNFNPASKFFQDEFSQPQILHFLQNFRTIKKISDSFAMAQNLEKGYCHPEHNATKCDKTLQTRCGSQTDRNNDSLNH